MDRKTFTEIDRSLRSAAADERDGWRAIAKTRTEPIPRTAYTARSALADWRRSIAPPSDQTLWMLRRVTTIQRGRLRYYAAADAWMAELDR